ncbi:hypothetical protein FRC0474_00377 [Corynebacterium diphtheriae]|nr:hypothetical protein FRC0474_00377 [Corynebacterium diphtheriae]
MLLYEDTRMRAVEILRSLPIGNSGVSGLVQLAATLGPSVEFRPSIPPFPRVSDCLCAGGLVYK